MVDYLFALVANESIGSCDCIDPVFEILYLDQQSTLLPY